MRKCSYCLDIAFSLIANMKRLRSGLLLGTHQQKFGLQMFHIANDRAARCGQEGALL